MKSSPLQQRGKGLNRRPLSPWAITLPLSYPLTCIVFDEFTKTIPLFYCGFRTTDCFNCFCRPKKKLCNCNSDDQSTMHLTTLQREDNQLLPFDSDGRKCFILREVLQLHLLLVTKTIKLLSLHLHDLCQSAPHSRCQHSLDDNLEETDTVIYLLLQTHLMLKNLSYFLFVVKVPIFNRLGVMLLLWRKL